MAKKTLTTMSVEDKLKALYDLQIVDRRIDEIRNLRGELPLEVKDLEDEIAGLAPMPWRCHLDVLPWLSCKTT